MLESWLVPLVLARYPHRCRLIDSASEKIVRIIHTHPTYPHIWRTPTHPTPTPTHLGIAALHYLGSTWQVASARRPHNDLSSYPRSISSRWRGWLQIVGGLQPRAFWERRLGRQCARISLPLGLFHTPFLPADAPLGASTTAQVAASALLHARTTADPHAAVHRPAPRGGVHALFSSAAISVTSCAGAAERFASALGGGNEARLEAGGHDCWTRRRRPRRVGGGICNITIWMVAFNLRPLCKEVGRWLWCTTS